MPSLRACPSKSPIRLVVSRSVVWDDSPSLLYPAQWIRFLTDGNIKALRAFVDTNVANGKLKLEKQPKVAPTLASTQHTDISAQVDRLIEEANKEAREEEQTA